MISDKWYDVMCQDEIPSNLFVVTNCSEGLYGGVNIKYMRPFIQKIKKNENS